MPETTPEMDALNARLETARRRAVKTLKGFSADFPDEMDPWHMHGSRPDKADFPVPELVLFLLRNLMRWRWQGPGEKTRWTVLGSVEGEPVAFELRKFGFTILRGENPKISDARIVGQLKSALKDVEDLLGLVAEAQVAHGKALIINRAGEFEARYRFFRNLADKAYSKASRAPRKKKSDNVPAPGFADMIGFLNHSMAANQQGFFQSTAMVDAYFSALEHRLVLLRAFTGRPMAEGEMLTLLASKWDGKLKDVLPVEGDPEAADLLGRLRRLKERVRNPFAHGGVENDGGSIFVHIPGLGALPANFSRFGDSVRFSLHPIDADDHAEACALFDALDLRLSSGALEGAHTMLRAGVDPSFDAETLTKYATACSKGPESVEAFIEHWSRAWERHANMDY